jgi:hypothetical protein
LLFAIDYTSYCDLGGRLCSSVDEPTPGTEGEVQP